MPIIPAQILEKLRTHVFPKYLINTTTSVKKILSYTTETSNPHYPSSKVPVFTEYNNFVCSIINMLSGKVNRLFGEREMSELIAELGIVGNEAYVIQYVSDQELVPGVYNNLILDEQILIELETCDSGACDNWWKVRKVIPDSEGLLHTAIVTK